MIIAFLGVDGVGKTTIGRKLQKILAEKNHKVEYRKEFDYFFIKYVLKLYIKIFGYKKFSKTRKKVIVTGEKSYYYKFWVWFVWLDYFLEYLLLKLSKRNKVIIMDRYVYDFLVSLWLMGYKIKFAQWLFYKFPKPDLAFVLDASPQVDYKRKLHPSTYTLDFFKQARSYYLKLAKDLQLNLIDTTNDTINQTLKKVLTKIEESNLDYETRMIFKTVTGNFDPRHDGTDFKAQDWLKLLKRASSNHLLYFFVERLLGEEKLKTPKTIVSKLGLIKKEAETHLLKLKQTTNLVTSALVKAKIPFLIIKTMKDIPYVTFDVDLLVKMKDFDRCQKALNMAAKKNLIRRKTTPLAPRLTLFKFLKADLPRALKINLKPFRKRIGKERHLDFQKLLRIDLYGNLLWQGSRFIDESLIWKKRKIGTIQGIKCPIPSTEIEVALAIVHTINERRYISLMDFLFIKKRCANVDWDLLLAQAKKYKWEKLLLRFVTIFNGLNRKLFPNEVKPAIVIKHKVDEFKIRGPLSMSFMYPLRYGLETFWYSVRITSTIPIFEILYFVYAKIRHYLSGKEKVPVYIHWFPFDKLKLKEE